MNVFRVSDIVAQQEQINRRYTEAMRVPAMSVGVYRLPVGSQDLQHPHSEDEMYYVVKGVGQLQVGDEVTKVEPGTFVHVPPGVPHKFISIVQDLVLLVYFAPAEGAHAEK